MKKMPCAAEEVLERVQEVAARRADRSHLPAGALDSMDCATVMLAAFVVDLDRRLKAIEDSMWERDEEARGRMM